MKASSLSILILGASAFSFSCSQASFRAVVKEEKLRKELANHSFFVAGRKANADLSYSFLPESALQTLELKSLARPNVSYQQSERPMIHDVFVQGHSGDEVKEDFPVATLDKLDLLVVVDNSSSMEPYQDRLAKGLSPLLSHIANVDWHMMVTTTSTVRKRNPANPSEVIVSYGCPRVKADGLDKAVLTRDEFTKNPSELAESFAWKVKVGESGDPIEHGILTAVSGLKGECGDSSKAWVRSDSHKAVLILTDEENCGSDPDQNCDGSADSEADYFFQNAPAKTQFFALLHDPDRYAECQDQGYIRKPVDYRSVIERSGGMEGNICVDNYNDTLENISKNMHPVARVDYELGFAPENGSILLEVDGKAWDGRYKLTGKTLHLETPIPSGIKVLSVKYRHNAVPLSRKYVLSQFPAPDTLVVKVNGKTVDASLLDLEGLQLTLPFLPDELARIEVNYRRSGDLPKIFALPSEALISRVQVFIDDLETKDFQIVGIDSIDIVLKSAPKDGAKIRIEYETKDTRILKYDAMKFAEGEVGEVRAFDTLTQVEIPIQVESGSVEFQADDVVNGRKVDILYALNPKTKELSLELSKTPIEGSLAIRSSGSGEECLANMSLNGTRLNFPCPSSDIGRLQVSYDYISGVDSSFKVAGNYTQSAIWSVKIDGVETKDYVREKNVLSFPHHELKPETVIEVQVWELVND